MAISFLDNVTLGDNQLQNVVIQVLASDPTGVTGKLIYNSTSNVLKYYNGSGWISLTADTNFDSWDLSDGSSSATITSGQTATIAQGVGMTTALDTRTITVSLNEATSTVRGGIELFSDTDQSVAANAVSTTASRTYGLQLNSSGQGVVNVPWTDTSGMTSWTVTADSGGSVTVGDGQTVDWAGGTGITTAYSTPSGNRTVTITNSKPFDSLTLASTSGSNSTIANSGTITLAAGAGITTTNNGSGQVTIEATGSGSMSSFTLTGDSGTNQTIADGNTLDVAGGTNISTVVGTTDTVTVNLDDSITLAGDLTVTGGDITLGGAGRIQGVDTVTDATDAANKNYVDTQLAGSGLLIFQGGYNAATNTPNLDNTPSLDIKKGWSYVVTAAGNFFTEAVEVGDLLIAEQDDPTTLANWTTVQNNVDLATAANVGIGNVNIDGAGTKDGLALVYSSGTATVGLDISSLPSLTTLNTSSVAAFYDPEGDDNNVKVTAANIAASLNGLTSKKLTTSSQTSHVFTHNLDTFDVIVQLYDTSSKETVYASVDRTSVNVVTVTTAASASLTALIQKIG
tara:strand:+ start:12 stop:1718 length:1707 start_codon:yes stop_codon:yes gene_type:complete